MHPSRVSVTQISSPRVVSSLAGQTNQRSLHLQRFAVCSQCVIVTLRTYSNNEVDKENQTFRAEVKASLLPRLLHGVSNRGGFGTIRYWGRQSLNPASAVLSTRLLNLFQSRRGLSAKVAPPSWFSPQVDFFMCTEKQPSASFPSGCRCGIWDLQKDLLLHLCLKGQRCLIKGNGMAKGALCSSDLYS